MQLKEKCASNTWINAYACAKRAPWVTEFVSTNLPGQIPGCRSSRYEETHGQINKLLGQIP